MKKVLKEILTYVFTLLILSVVTAISLIPYFLLDQDINKWNYLYVFIGSCGLSLLIGFIAGDIYKFVYRNNFKEWDKPLPNYIKNMSFRISIPFYFSSFVLAIISTILYIINQAS